MNFISQGQRSCSYQDFEALKYLFLCRHIIETLLLELCQFLRSSTTGEGLKNGSFEPRREKTGYLHMQKKTNNTQISFAVSNREA